MMKVLVLLSLLAVAFCAPVDDEQPQSIDEAIMKAMGGEEAAKRLSYGLQEDGTMLAELDMRLTPEQYGAMYMKHIRSKRKFERRARKWTIPIPYYIRNDFNSRERGYITTAMDNISKVTCLKFVQRTSQRNYIQFQNGNGCNSPLGMVGGRQVINLGSGCRYIGTVIHEIGHSLGLVHEHQLPDRKIWIDYNNVNPTWARWFKAYTTSEVDQTGVPYDYRSIMHYGIRAFSSNGGQTIHANDKSKEYLIQDTWHKNQLADSDIKVINNIYCGGTSSGSGNTGTNANCVDNNSNCSYWASIGECNRNPGYMLNYCKKSCKQC